MAKSSRCHLWCCSNFKRALAAMGETESCNYTRKTKLAVAKLEERNEIFCVSLWIPLKKHKIANYMDAYRHIMKALHDWKKFAINQGQK